MKVSRRKKAYCSPYFSTNRKLDIGKLTYIDSYTADHYGKRKLIGSIYPEKFAFEELKV